MKRHNTIASLVAIFVIAICCSPVKSQIFFNNGALIHIDTATTMQINGGLQDDNAIGGPGTWINDGRMIITSNGSSPGDILITNNAVLQGNGKYYLDQDWINDAVFNAGRSTVEMDGNLKELITSNTGTVTTFDTLMFKGTGTNMNRRKQQTLDANVSDALVLNDRVLFTAGHTMYITTPNRTAITNDTTYLHEGFVASTGTGRLSRMTNTSSSYYFPVGADSMTLRYRKVLLTPASSNPNTYAVRLANNDATNDGDSIGFIDTSLCKVNKFFYHQINLTSGSDSADIDIFYNTVADGPWYNIAQWNTPVASLWNYMGTVTNATAIPYNSVLKRKWGNFSNDAFILGASPPKAFIYGKTSVCSGEATTLTATGGTIYLWSNGDSTSSISVSPGANTKYYLTVSNGECTAKDSVSVIVNPLPTAYACCSTAIFPGGNVALNSTGGVSYQWSPPAGLNCNNCPDPIASPNVTTTYTVTVTSDSGCTATANVLIIVACPSVNICCDSSISQGENVQLNASGGNTYIWSPSTGLSCDTCSSPIASPLQTTTYTVTIIDDNCVFTQTVTIDVTCGNIFVPNAFSPDEAHNAILYVRGPCIASIDFNVFDRWGNKVFESENLNSGWDGTYKGQPLNVGTYIWYVKATLFDGTSIQKHGNVALVR